MESDIELLKRENSEIRKRIEICINLLIANEIELEKYCNQ